MHIAKHSHHHHGDSSHPSPGAKLTDEDVSRIADELLRRIPIASGGASVDEVSRVVHEHLSQFAARLEESLSHFSDGQMAALQKLLEGMARPGLVTGSPVENELPVLSQRAAEAQQKLEEISRKLSEAQESSLDMDAWSRRTEALALRLDSIASDITQLSEKIGQAPKLSAVDLAAEISAQLRNVFSQETLLAKVEELSGVPKKLEALAGALVHLSKRPEPLDPSSISADLVASIVPELKKSAKELLSNVESIESRVRVLIEDDLERRLNFLVPGAVAESVRDGLRQGLDPKSIVKPLLFSLSKAMTSVAQKSERRLKAEIRTLLAGGTKKREKVDPAIARAVEKGTRRVTARITRAVKEALTPPPPEEPPPTPSAPTP